MTVIEALGLKVSYIKSKKVFSYPDIYLNEGECLGIYGPSGVGKTTLLNALCMSRFPGYVDYTRVKLCGYNIEKYSKDLLYQKISYMPQFSQNALNPSLSIEKQIGLIQKSSANSANTDQINKWIKDLGLTKDVLNQYSFQLSGGMKQRLTFLFGLIKNPKLYIIDEPTSGLDNMTMYSIYRLLKKQKEKDLSVIIVSHELGFIEAISDKKLNFGGNEWGQKAL